MSRATVADIADDRSLLKIDRDSIYRLRIDLPLHLLR